MINPVAASSNPVPLPTAAGPQDDRTPATVTFQQVEDFHDTATVQKLPSPWKGFNYSKRAGHVVEADIPKESLEDCQVIAELLLKKGKTVEAIFPGLSRINYSNQDGTKGTLDVSLPDPKIQESIPLANAMQRLAEVEKKRGRQIASFATYERGDHYGASSLQLNPTSRVSLAIKSGNQLRNMPNFQPAAREFRTATAMVDALTTIFTEELTASEATLQTDPNHKDAQRAKYIHMARLERLKEHEGGTENRAAMLWALTHPDVMDSYKNLKGLAESRQGPGVSHFWKKVTGNNNLTPEELAEIEDIVLLNVNDPSDMQEERYLYEKARRELEDQMGPDFEAKKKQSSMPQLLCKLAMMIESADSLQDLEDNLDSILEHSLISNLTEGLSTADQMRIRGKIQEAAMRLCIENIYLKGTNFLTVAQSDTDMMNILNEQVEEYHKGPPSPLRPRSPSIGSVSSFSSGVSSAGSVSSDETL